MVRTVCSMTSAAVVLNRLVEDRLLPRSQRMFGMVGLERLVTLQTQLFAFASKQVGMARTVWVVTVHTLGCYFGMLVMLGSHFTDVTAMTRYAHLCVVGAKKLATW